MYVSVKTIKNSQFSSIYVEIYMFCLYIMAHHTKSKSTLLRRNPVKKLAGKAVKGLHKTFDKAFHSYDKSVQGATGTRGGQ